LSDFKCTVRFGIAGQLSPAGSPAQNQMVERYNAGLGKVLPTFGDMPPDRIKERLQGEAQSVATRLQSKSMTPPRHAAATSV
jgi:transposase InsO family protein